MIQLPKKLLYLDSLSLIQRAILPIIVDSSSGWWSDEKKGIDALSLAKIVDVHVNQIVPELDNLISQQIVAINRIKSGSNTIFYYRVNHTYISNLQESQDATKKSTNVAIYEDQNQFLNISHEKYIELQTFAISTLDGFDLPSSIFEDFEIENRSQNRSSQDWCAEFMKYIRENIPTSKLKQNSSKYKTTLAEYKPPLETIELTKYFISKLKAIDPQFIEPFDLLSWAKQINYLIKYNKYTLHDIESGINWLFSEQGNWYRPNVKNAEDLNKKFSYIISHVRSFRDGEKKLPADIDLFELIKNRDK